jgi:hypothetical protein
VKIMRNAEATTPAPSPRKAPGSMDRATEAPDGGSE